MNVYVLEFVAWFQFFFKHSILIFNYLQKKTVAKGLI